MPQPHACSTQGHAAQAAPAPAGRAAAGASAHVTLRLGGGGCATAKALPAAGHAPKEARTGGAAGRSWGTTAAGGAPGAAAGAQAAGDAAEELRHALLELQETRELSEARLVFTGCLGARRLCWNILEHTGCQRLPKGWGRP